jgi:hypothetical protein
MQRIESWDCRALDPIRWRFWEFFQRWIHRIFIWGKVTLEPSMWDPLRWRFWYNSFQGGFTEYLCWRWCGGSKRYSGYILPIFLFSTSLLQIFWVLPAPLISTEGWYIGNKEVHAQNNYLVIINRQDPLWLYHPPQNTAIFSIKAPKKSTNYYILVTYIISHITFMQTTLYTMFLVEGFLVFTLIQALGPNICAHIKCQSSFFWFKKVTTLLMEL